MNYDGRLPLHIAAEEGQKELVIDLIDHGSEVNVEDADGDTPLDLAMRNNVAAMVQVLLEAGDGHGSPLPVTKVISIRIFYRSLQGRITWSTFHETSTTSLRFSSSFGARPTVSSGRNGCRVLSTWRTIGFDPQ